MNIEISQEDARFIVGAIRDALTHYVQCNCGSIGDGSGTIKSACTGTCTHSELTTAVVLLQRTGA